MANKIIIKSPAKKPSAQNLAGHVRITPEAEIYLRRLAEETEMSIRYLASEIILQAADLIEVEYQK